MASQTRSPGTLADSAALGGTIAWTNPANAAASDDVYATCVFSAQGAGHALLGTNYGFSIPAGTVDGIVVEVERKMSGATGHDNSLFLTKDAFTSLAGTDHSDQVTNWPAADAYKTYGTSTDLWGTTWTPAEVNASGFGFGIGFFNGVLGANTASIDHLRVTVYYPDPPPIAIPTVSVFVPLGTERSY